MRRLLHPAALALCLLGAGCGDGARPGAAVIFDPCRPLVLAPDATASDAERQAIAGAALLWNAAAGSRLVLESADGAPELPITFQSAAAAFHGLYDDRRGSVYINHDVADGPTRAIVIAHEVGHAFGLPHVAHDARASVMNAGNLDVLPTAADVETLAMRWGRCTE